MNIKLTLSKKLIIEAVKSETFLRGQVDKAIDPKSAAAAYHEQAGDETYQERLIERALYSSLEELKTHLNEYLSSSGGTTADNLIATEEEDDLIEITLLVSDRFNISYVQSLARLSSRFIEESILMDWWKPINEKQSALYGTFVERDLASVKRCFNKTAPTIPSVPYTKHLSTTGSAFDIGIGDEETVSYIIDDGSIDDIECSVEDRTIVKTNRSDNGFTLTGLRYGHTYITMYSRHDPDVSVTVHVYVTNQD